MRPITDNPATYAASRLVVARTKIPRDMEIHRELGRGTNNRVFSATCDGGECVLRAPRRRSDTQQRGSALWEFRHTLKAAQMGVGPAVYRAWYARHANGKWPSGLYVVTERFPYDLDTMITKRDDLREDALARRDAIETAIVQCLEALARELVFVYDIKPSNIVLRLEDSKVEKDVRAPVAGEDPSDKVVARVIDFGRDFCEWAGCEQDPSSNTPNVDMVRKRVQQRDPSLTLEEVRAETSHILFATMLVIMAATTTHCLFQTRHDHRMGAAMRADMNPVVRSARAMLDSMQGRNIALVRELLRMDDVRGVLRHYHGRRSSGTRRTLALARGVEM